MFWVAHVDEWRMYFRFDTDKSVEKFENIRE